METISNSPTTFCYLLPKLTANLAVQKRKILLNRTLSIGNTLTRVCLSIGCVTLDELMALQVRNKSLKGRAEAEVAEISNS